MRKPDLLKIRYSPPTYIFAGFLVFGLAFVIAASKTGAIGQDGQVTKILFIPILLGCMVLLYGFYRLFKEYQQLTKRAEIFKQLAKKHEWKIIEGLPPPAIKNASLLKITDTQIQYDNAITAPDWTYVDLKYATYLETRYGTYRKAVIYYGVMSTDLPRALPNVVFDSLKQRGRQFSTVFDKKQLHSLEGDFDQHFATYFARDYTIDSMSFITPDVMEALIEADDYDIEIVGKQLLIYGSMYEPSLQLKEMSEKLGIIKKQLLDNILTYRDERLPFAEGRQTVSAKGMFLKRRRIGIWLVSIVVLFYASLFIINLFIE